MSSDYVEETTRLMRELEGHELIPQIVQLLSQGEPVRIERIAAASGLAASDVEDRLRDHLSAERDEEGRIVGFALTLRPTPHRYTAGGRTFYAWCATDTLMLPVILGQPAVVESTCPRTREPIRIEVTPEGIESVDPPSAVLSAVRPGGRFADVRASTCAFGHFFASGEAAAGWVAEHPDGYVHSVGEEFELDREVMRQLGWEAAVARVETKR